MYELTLLAIIAFGLLVPSFQGLSVLSLIILAAIRPVLCICLLVGAGIYFYFQRKP